MDENCQPCSSEIQNMSCCPEDFEQLKRQINEEVENLQMELHKMQHEKEQLIQQRNLLKCSSPCAPCPSYGRKTLSKHSSTINIPHKTCEPCVQISPHEMVDNSSMQQLKDLREKYFRLQEDYKSKVCEVSCLRVNVEQLKCSLNECEVERKKQESCMASLEKKAQLLEAERGNKEQIIEQEQALIVAKHRYNEIQDELEEMRNNMQQQIAQTEEYRKKYLQAQQIFEEQKRQLELMEMDNARINENVNIEISRIKSQFQEKLSALAPLPDVLKETQAKLQESQQLQSMSERYCCELQKEVACLKDQLQTANSQMESLCKESAELQSTKSEVCKLKKQLADLEVENASLKKSQCQIDEQRQEMQKKIEEKLHEIVQLTAMVEQIREDSARQVVRSKERSDKMRQTLQNQISQLEVDLAQCKAITRAAQKDRDEIRQKIQNQINILNESFTQAHGRINLLQGHLNYLKDSNSDNLLSTTGESSPVLKEPLSYRGYDSCQCNR